MTSHIALSVFVLLMCCAVTLLAADVASAHSSPGRETSKVLSETTKASQFYATEDDLARLMKTNTDQASPPAWSFDEKWQKSPFLSYALLLYGNTPGFSHLKRFLQSEDVAEHVPGAGYTLFAPTDKAFEDAGLKDVPDDYFSKEDTRKVLLSHFVKDKFYSKDLRAKEPTLTSLSGYKLPVGKTAQGNTTVEKAVLTDDEKEFFVFNLGHVFPVDKLFDEEALKH